MRLISLSLVNIRSYERAQVRLEEGTTLLCGDIGAGKSTLLIAVEFGLFGLSRGELSGASLLRHGSPEGSVTIEFSCEGVRYAIMRALRRTRNGIVQDAGWLERDGRREALTPTELKAKVFEILGYPLHALAKKNLLYRFTLYTPQEEMKSIILESPEARIETLRRVFGVDVYKTVRDNAQLLARDLKAKEAAHEDVLARMREEAEHAHARLANAQALAAQQQALAKEREQAARGVTQADIELKGAQDALQAHQKEKESHAQLERSRKLAQDEIAQLERERAERGRRVAQSRDALARLGPALSPAQGQDIAVLKAALATAQKDIAQLQQDAGKMLAIIEQCGHDPKVRAGEECPTCRQQVPESHLAALAQGIDARRSAAQLRLEKTRKQAAERTRQADELARSIEQEREREMQMQRRAILEQAEKDATQDLARIDALMQRRLAEIAQLPVLSPEAQAASAQASAALHARESAAQRKSALARELLLAAERKIGALGQELRELEAVRERLSSLDAQAAEREGQRKREAALRAWLSDRFSPFTSSLEQHVLLAIHATFDAALREWFSRLVEDDALSVRLDREFSPLVQQHGYDTDIAHLSGGERTAVALAYRLALVRTVHALLPHLGTSGLIMLDEPTDGFSSEQLVRMQEVLRELRMGQVVLVSHEQQLEGAVDHIVRVRKGSSGSSIEQQE